MNQQLATSEESKKGLKELNNKLVDQLKCEKSKVDELNMKLGTNNANIKEKEDIIEENKLILNTLSERNNEFIETVNSLKDELKKETDINEKNKNYISSLEEQINKNENTISKNNAQISKLKLNIENLQNEKDDLLIKLTTKDIEMKSKIASHQYEINDLKSSQANLTKNYNIEKNRAIKYHEKMEQLQQELKKATEELDETKTSLDIKEKET
eukprot:jgi/Orpsp1_1/1184469/evm.model.c7180000089661.1